MQCCKFQPMQCEGLQADPSPITIKILNLVWLQWSVSYFQSLVGCLKSWINCIQCISHYEMQCHVSKTIVESFMLSANDIWRFWLTDVNRCLQWKQHLAELEEELKIEPGAETVVFREPGCSKAHIPQTCCSFPPQNQVETPSVYWNLFTYCHFHVRSSIYTYIMQWSRSDFSQNLNLFHVG